MVLGVGEKGPKKVGKKAKGGVRGKGRGKHVKRAKDQGMVVCPDGEGRKVWKRKEP